MLKKLSVMANRIAICLFRNDLRYHDNEVLAYAHKNADLILPLYCFDPNHYKGTHHFNFPKTGTHRVKFTLESVNNLRENLLNHGNNLMIAYGHPDAVVTTIFNNLTSSKLLLICQSEVTKEETDVEKRLQKLCDQKKASFVKIWGSTLYHKSDLPFPISAVPNSYTAFRKDVEYKVKIRPETAMPEKLKPSPDLTTFGLEWGSLPSYEQLNSPAGEPKLNPSSAFPFKGGETCALARLKSYLWDTNAVAKYKETRNGLIGTDYSTKFSPWLALGCLSPRKVHWELEKYERERTKNDSTYWVRFELLWRDYFRFVSLKFGDTIFYPYGMKGRRQQQGQWKKDMQLFRAWQMGQTGVPFVDANMRELLATGWMSNRGRQNVASFLVKDLHLDWRLGAEWFESLLLDHDVTSNYGNWNYVAGIGNDPREDRKFNMIKQSMDYDLNGDFLRLWVPELKDIPSPQIHTPWSLSFGALSAAKVKLGESYPNPIVVAPEWNRHQKGNKKDGMNTNTGSAPSKSGSQRGIDFYFKSPAGGKK